MNSVVDSRPSRPWPAFGLLTLAVLGFVAAGHEGRRIVQLMMLALPPLMWMLWPVRSRPWRWLRLAAVGTVVLAFGFDGATRAYLQHQYDAAPDSSVVLDAVANTNGREAIEYLQSNGLQAGLWGLAGAAGVAAVFALLARGFRAGAPMPVGARRVLVVVLVLCSIGYLSKPWRRLHPLAYWPRWVDTVQTMRSTWADQQASRARKLAHAERLSPSVDLEGPSTVVLVLTDSVNRDNMSLYGYPRDTTPRLKANLDALGEQWLVLPHAWSTEPGTLASLRGIFGFGRPEADSSLHLVALARAAGYKVWWMSNHDDVAINQAHARLADVVEGVNRQPGRSGASLDGELLDDLEEALVDRAPRKFVVVHLLGAHPHYRLRQPPRWDPFQAPGDAVDRRLAEQGRPAWLREMRRDYDEAIHYHDSVVAETLRLARAAGDLSGHRAWMYLSDHGQEVGHTTNRVGHSLNTPAGYKIPALIWRNGHGFAQELEARPFRADWAAWTVADLLHLRWSTAEPQRNILHAGYRWEAPTLPVSGVRFAE